MSFNPSDVAVRNGNFFGLPVSLEEASIAVVSAPWDVTTSYRDGTCKGPEAILEASYQLDFFSPYLANAWEMKLAAMPFRPDWKEKNATVRPFAKSYISFLENGGKLADSPDFQRILRELNKECAAFHTQVSNVTLDLLDQDKRVLLLGGDHSVSISGISALLERGERFSVLHFDAHADLRDKYEGFNHSHASIMNNVLQLGPAVERLTQVGIRDISPEEVERAAADPRVRVFHDWDLHANRARGVNWRDQCDDIIATLSDNVYISFDIDGLDPRFCPNTGTPVPGGLELNDALFLMNRVIERGKKIVGADLVEVAPGNDEWDANVGARVLFNLAVLLAKSWKI